MRIESTKGELRFGFRSRLKRVEHPRLADHECESRNHGERYEYQRLDAHTSLVRRVDTGALRSPP